MAYLYLKAVHIIFIVCWFAGVFYLPRLFIYNIEAQAQSNDNVRTAMSAQFVLMAKRLWFGITIPAALISVGTGIALLIHQHYIPYLLSRPMLWLLIKLILVLLFLGYNYSLHRILMQQKKGIFKVSSQYLRIWNEVATVILFAVVFLAVVKQALSLAYALFGILFLIVLLGVAINIYKKIRRRKDKHLPKN